MAKKRPPCIRNLKCFEETGCPQCSWDGDEGCTAWIEMNVGQKDNPNTPVLKKMCVDMWGFDLAFSTLGALEGNQQALEAFRNGMVMINPEGVTHPKPDPAVVELLNMVHGQIQKQNIIQEHEDKKLIGKI